MVHGHVVVLDQQAIHVFSLLGEWLDKVEAEFPAETLTMTVFLPYLYVSSVEGVQTFKIEKS